MGKLFKGKSVLFTWVISYILILIVPLSISFSVFLYVESIVSEEILNSNSYMMQQIQQEADEVIRDVRKINIDIMSDFQIKEVVNYGTALSDEQYYYIQKAKYSILKNRASNTSLTDMFLYLRAVDLIITPTNIMSSSEYYNIYLKQYTSYEKWYDILCASYPTTSYMPVTMNNNVNVRTDNIMCLRSFGTDNIDTAVIVSFIDQSAILDSFNPIREMSGGYVNIIDTKNSLLLNGAGSEVLNEITFEELADGNNFIYKTINGKKYVISYIKSQDAGFVYLCAYPKSLFSHKVIRIRRFMLAGIICSVIIGGFLLYYSVKRNYSPMQSLVKMLASHRGIQFSKNENEFSFISNIISNTLEENKQASKLLEKQNSVIRNAFFSRLLKANKISSVSVEETLENLSLNVNGKYFYTALFYIENTDSLFEDDNLVSNEERENLAEVIIRNVSGELIGEKYLCELVEVDNLTVYIIMTDDDSQTRNITSVLRHIHDFIYENFSLNTQIILSGATDNLIGLAQLYRSCIDTMEYNIIFGVDNVLSASELNRKSGGSYDYPIEKEFQLISYIKSGNCRKAEALLDSLLENNIMRNEIGSFRLRLLFYDIVSTLIKASDENNQELFASLEQCAQSCGIKEFAAAAKEAVRLLCTENAACGEKSALVNEIADYINENYSLDTLNVSAIAQAFGMSASYISKKFKQEYGESLLDYIHSVRISKAKSLMSDASASVEAISSSVGYTSVKTFSRAFKKIIGMTPAEFRRQEIYKLS